VSAATTPTVAARLEGVVGAPFLQAERSLTAEYAIDGVTPKMAARPQNADQTAEIVRIAAEEKLGVISCGARSATCLGMPPASYDIALDLTRVTGIAHYDPGDLTVSVNAGMPLAELANVLAEKNQFLPLIVPFFEKATVGGAIAGGLDSPLRFGYGTPRDFLIGAEFVDGTGALAKSGGRVVKNVTGYDFHKLLCGSLGTLAVITRLNFRTYPLPVARRGFLASFSDQASALAFASQIAGSALTPVLLETLSPECANLLLAQDSPIPSLQVDTRAWSVCVGFEGSSEVCDRYARELSQLARKAVASNAIVIHGPQFAALVEILREAPATLRASSPQAVVMKFSVLPSQLADVLRALRSFAGSSWLTAPLLVRSSSVVYLALVPRAGDDATLAQTEYFWKSVGSLRGKLEFRAAMLFCPPEWKPALHVWAHVGENAEMERRVKKAFDPGGVFARARFVGGI